MIDPTRPDIQALHDVKVQDPRKRENQAVLMDMMKQRDTNAKKTINIEKDHDKFDVKREC